jgi:hypothetical protein
MASTRRRRKRCRFCDSLFLPDPRLRSRQIACSKSQCQEARKRANQKDWIGRHPGYFQGRYPKLKPWHTAHPGYLAEYRRTNPEKTIRDNALRKERHELARKGLADIQDSIALQAPVVKRLEPLLAGGASADIQDSLLADVVVASIFSSRFAPRLRRRYTRLDGLRKPPPVRSLP